MKSIILYGAYTKLSNLHKQVAHQGPWSRKSYFVRAELFDGDTLSALDEAKPRKGETVLNTVPLTPEST